MFGSSAWKRSSFLGGETGLERGHGFLGFHNEPVVEPAESWVLAGRPPPPPAVLHARRLYRGACALSARLRFPLWAAQATWGVWVPGARTTVV